MIVVPNFSVFEFGTAFEVFGVDRSDRGTGVPAFDFRVCTPVPGEVPMKSGLSLHVGLGLEAAADADLVIMTPFGKDADVCKAASPLTHVAGNHPPFLLAYADNDFPHLDKMAENMQAALKKADSPVELVRCKDRNHITIIVQFVNNTDPLNKAFRDFVQKNCK